MSEYELTIAKGDLMINGEIVKITEEIPVGLDGNITINKNGEIVNLGNIQANKHRKAKSKKGKGKRRTKKEWER